MADQMSEIRNGTGAGLLEFLDFAGSKGLMKSVTARAYRSAAVKVLSIDSDEVDINQLDVEDHLRRFEVISGHEYTPGSLSTYKARFKSAVEMYRAWLKDPESVKAPVRQRRTARKTSQDNGVRPHGSSNQDRDMNQHQREMHADLLDYPFPLRSGETAHLRLPRHLTSEDVKRLSIFLESLAIDPSAQLPSGSQNG